MKKTGLIVIGIAALALSAGGCGKNPDEYRKLVAQGRADAISACEAGSKFADGEAPQTAPEACARGVTSAENNVTALVLENLKVRVEGAERVTEFEIPFETELFARMSADCLHRPSYKLCESGAKHAARLMIERGCKIKLADYEAADHVRCEIGRESAIQPQHEVYIDSRPRK
jgi:hypothetical protein